jgi:hypothetical protein
LDANKEGYQQNLWLFGSDHQVTEVGTMNCFVFWKNEQGERELITPELDGSILPGVTRDSILSLARQWGEFKVSERKFTMKDLVKADKEGRIIEMFGKFFIGLAIDTRWDQPTTRLSYYSYGSQNFHWREDRDCNDEEGRACVAMVPRYHTYRGGEARAMLLI